MHTTTNTVAHRPDLWAACALPGDGPEFRFAAPRTLLRSLTAFLRRCRTGVR